MSDGEMKVNEEPRVITEARVYEVSIVERPADPNCTIQVVGAEIGYEDKED